MSGAPFRPVHRQSSSTRANLGIFDVDQFRAREKAVASVLCYKRRGGPYSPDIYLTLSMASTGWSRIPTP